jgi:uncharacterized membrane protein YccC
MAARKKPLKVTEAVQRDLDRLAKRDPELAKSGLAASALALAQQLDSPENSATSKAMCAKALSETLRQLRELAAPERKEDRVDELTEKRARRRGARAAG